MNSNENNKENIIREKEQEQLNYAKGDGAPYVKWAMELESQMTPEEKKEEDEWWEELSKNFKVIEVDNNSDDSDENC